MFNPNEKVRIPKLALNQQQLGYLACLLFKSQFPDFLSFFVPFCRDRLISTYFAVKTRVSGIRVVAKGGYS
jgi:uncharacterized membrane protein